MTTHRTRRTPAPWRLALLASGIALVAGGGMHPDAEGDDSLREGLAAMTADDGWVPGHSLVLLSAVLLTVGLWGATRDNPWAAPVQPRLRLAAAAFAVYAVEAAFHLAAVVDSTALRDGGAAPIAWTHVALSAVAYPLSGAALAALAWQLVRTGSGARRAVAAVGVVAGVLHALSVPFTFALPDADPTAVFAAASVLLALWSVGTALVTRERPAPVPQRSHQLVA